MSKVLDIWHRVIGAFVEALLSGSEGEIAVKIVGAFIGFMFAFTVLLQVLTVFLPPV